jgi:hypothetical protein
MKIKRQNLSKDELEGVVGVFLKWMPLGVGLVDAWTKRGIVYGANHSTNEMEKRFFSTTLSLSLSLSLYFYLSLYIFLSLSLSLSLSFYVSLTHTFCET